MTDRIDYEEVVRLAERAVRTITEYRQLAAMLHDELRRVRDGVSTPETVRRAMETYEQAVGNRAP